MIILKKKLKVHDLNNFFEYLIRFLKKKKKYLRNTVKKKLSPLKKKKVHRALNQRIF